MKIRENSRISIFCLDSLLFKAKELGVVICGVSAFIYLFFPVSARADTIFLKNGRHFEGVVVEDGDRAVVFDVIMGSSRMRMSFTRGEIDRIERTTAREKETLEEEMAREREERAELEEEKRKEGLVLYRGKWITEEERRSAEEARKVSILGGRSLSQRPAAPNFELPDLENNFHSMHQYRGRVIFLFFFGVRSRTGASQIKALERAYEKYRDEGVVILGICVDTDIDRVRNFAVARKVSFTILCDGRGWKGPAVKKYDVRKLPFTFLIDGSGYIRSTGMLGDSIDKGIEKLLNK